MKVISKVVLAMILLLSYVGVIIAVKENTSYKTKPDTDIFHMALCTGKYGVVEYPDNPKKYRKTEGKVELTVKFKNGSITIEEEETDSTKIHTWQIGSDIIIRDKNGFDVALDSSSYIGIIKFLKPSNTGDKYSSWHQIARHRIDGLDYDFWDKNFNKYFIDITAISTESRDRVINYAGYPYMIDEITCTEISNP